MDDDKPLESINSANQASPIDRWARAHRIAERAREDDDEQRRRDGTDPMQAFANGVQELRSTAATNWPEVKIDNAIGQLDNLARSMISVTEAQARQQLQTHIAQQAAPVTSLRATLWNMAQSLPPSVTDRASYNALHQTLAPKALEIDTNIFAGSVRSTGNALNKTQAATVDASFAKADELATKKRQQAHRQVASDLVNQAEENPAAKNAHMDFAHTARQIERSAKKAPTGINREDIDDLKIKAQEMIETMREELSPQWSPDVQRWLKQGFLDKVADVYQSALGHVPKELLQETQAYEFVQDLRRGQPAFAPRANSQMQEAVGRSLPKIR